MDGIDNFLREENPNLLLLKQDFLISVMERFVENVEDGVVSLPQITDGEDLDEVRAHQSAYQEVGARLIPQMRTIAHIMNTHPDKKLTLLLFTKVFGNPAFAFYWDYMRQHTEIDKYKARLD
jgi:hypothetical protein